MHMLKGEQSASCDYLFAYGTLRVTVASPVADILAQTTEYAGEGCLQAELYDLGSYPGAVLSTQPGVRIWGDIYRIGDAAALFSVLDDFEECASHYAQPHEYSRKLVDIITRQGNILSAWAYLYNRRIDGLTQIVCGDYLRFSSNGMHEDQASINSAR